MPSLQMMYDVMPFLGVGTTSKGTFFKKQSPLNTLIMALQLVVAMHRSKHAWLLAVLAPEPGRLAPGRSVFGISSPHGKLPAA